MWIVGVSDCYNLHCIKKSISPPQNQGAYWQRLKTPVKWYFFILCVQRWSKTASAAKCVCQIYVQNRLSPKDLEFVFLRTKKYTCRASLLKNTLDRVFQSASKWLLFTKVCMLVLLNGLCEFRPLLEMVERAIMVSLLVAAFKFSMLSVFTQVTTQYMHSAFILKRKKKTWKHEIDKAYLTDSSKSQGYISMH